MIKAALMGAGIALLAAAPALSQTATDRAGELKAWREQCTDPDSDLRMAYVEAALETDDAAVIRICVRQSLESDNSDIRNLGLRATLASLEQLSFAIEPPAKLTDALESAEGDEDKLSSIANWFIARDWQSLQNGLVFAIQKADFARGTATWMPTVNLTKPSERNVGKLTIVGDAITWVGSASLANSECSLNARLTAGPALEGEWLCSRGEPFKVRADLL